MESQPELNTANFIQYLDSFLPEFKAIRRKDRDDSIEQYGIFWEFSSELKELLDNDSNGKNIPLIQRYFEYIELLVRSSVTLP